MAKTEADKLIDLLLAEPEKLLGTVIMIDTIAPVSPSQTIIDRFEEGSVSPASARYDATKGGRIDDTK